MEKFKIEVPRYGKSGLKPKIIEAKNQLDAVNEYVKQSLRGKNIGAVCTVANTPGNNYLPPHYSFLDNGNVFFNGVVKVEYAM